MKKILFTIFLFCEAAIASQYTMILPYSAGNQSDLAARTIIRAFEKITNETIVLENHPGGDGVLGITKFKNNTKADMLWVTSSTMVYNPIIKKDLPYDRREFNFCIFVGTAPSVWFTNPKYNIVKPVDLINDKMMKFAGSNASAGEVNIHALNKDMNKNLIIVPYKGTAEMTNHVASGLIDVGVAAGTSIILELAKAGKINVVGSSYHKDIQINDVLIQSISTRTNLNSFSGFVGIALRSGISEEKEKRLREGLWQALQDNEVKEKLKALFIMPDSSNDVEWITNHMNKMENSARRYFK